MNKLADKLTVMLLCAAAFTFSDGLVVPVVGLILSVIVTSFVWLTEGTVYAAAAVAASAVCCVAYHPVRRFEREKALAGSASSARNDGHHRAGAASDGDSFRLPCGDGDLLAAGESP